MLLVVGTTKANPERSGDAKLQIRQRMAELPKQKKAAQPFLWGDTMKELIITIIFILLMLTAIASAYAHDDWYESVQDAEASALAYSIMPVTTREIPADITTPAADGSPQVFTKRLLHNAAAYVERTDKDDGDTAPAPPRLDTMPVVIPEI